ncbi:MAG: hypothetical protein KDJ43_13645, partial [Rhizobiaceae bacterium]|nr:hypothetical protein [Rhizobiaceae bacterium]
MLESVCAGEPLRAAAAAIALIDQVLRTYGRHVRKVKKAKSQPSSAATTPTDSDPHVDDIRERLATLLNRRVPEGFPLPDLRSETSGGVIETGTAMRERLGVTSGARAAARAALDCNEAMMTLGCLLPGFGWDYAKGALHQTLLTDLRRFSELLQRLASLRQIADELGRMEANERTQRRTHGGGRDSVVGVRVGGEL